MKYQFGDRVYFTDEPDKIGIVFEVTDKQVQVGWNDGYTSFQKHTDNMKIITPPDTARWDWIEKRFGDNEMCLIKKGQSTYRQAIDNAMKQEQTATVKE